MSITIFNSFLLVYQKVTWLFWTAILHPYGKLSATQATKHLTEFLPTVHVHIWHDTDAALKEGYAFVNQTWLENLVFYNIHRWC